MFIAKIYETIIIIKSANKQQTFSFNIDERCGRELLQTSVIVDLLVVQVLEGEPVTEGGLQHIVEERTSQCKMYKSDLEVVKW